MGDEKVTAAVTVDEQVVGAIIPEFLLRNPDNTWKHPPVKAPASSTPRPPKLVTAPAAASSGGDTFGCGTDTTPNLDLNSFRVDPDEIESKIRHEADRRWRSWTPSKEQPKRPRPTTFLKQVRKEFY